MKIPVYQIDAFTDEPFSANPAAVCPLKEWLPETVMQKIANAMNLPETVFFVPTAGVNEDPATGSSHTILMPYWSKRLRRHKLVGRQVSARGRTMHCELAGDRVKITGNVAETITGELNFSL